METKKVMLSDADVCEMLKAVKAWMLEAGISCYACGDIMVTVG